MSTRKEVQKEEAEKKEIPPSPPIGRKGEEEKEPPSSARARTDNWIGETPPNGPINLTKPPELGIVLWHAHRTLGIADPAFVHEWYADMCGSFWCDGKGRPIKNWGRCLTVWYRNKARIAALRAVPETNNRRDAYRHIKRPDNWVGMDEASRREFLKGIE